VHWQALGRSARGLWGECKGSALYQTRVDLLDYSSKCTCPSRKFPCKHALGLLFLAAAAAAQLTERDEPQWVADWLNQRQQKAQAKAQPAEKKPVDEKAQAKRADARISAMLAGLDVTERWLHDLVQQGLAQSDLDQQLKTAALRLQDAKAGALAERLRQIGAMSERQQSERIAQLGQVQWLIDLFRRRDQLSAAWRAEVDAWVGLSEREEEVLDSGERVSGEFFIAGVSSIEGERLREERTWLIEPGGRSFLKLEFLFGAARGALFPAGASVSGTLALYRACAAQRVLLAQTELKPTQVIPALHHINEALTLHAAQLARSPFCRTSAACVADLTVIAHQDSYWLHDRSGVALPIAAGEAGLLAFLRTGAHPATIAFAHDGHCAQLLGFAMADAPPSSWAAL